MNPHFNSFDESLGITLSASSNILHNVVNVSGKSVQYINIFIKVFIWGILIG